MDMKQVSLAHLLWKQHLKPGDWVIDATCGNGYDAEFLSQLGLGKLTCIDIQSAAIEATRSRVPEAYMYLGCHSQLPLEAIGPNLRLIVYNLGYLPGGNKEITTSLASTKASIAQGLDILPSGGAMSIMFYPGHNEGLEEFSALMPMLKALDSRSFAVKSHQWLNRNRSPHLIFILKIK
ncbi:MAG: class I SAM-dependent methyltransferase [Chlamydiales bacterium]|nr:class I SAM-dependent methyltransferase [Chlamydiales bacterium]